jgi:hypothetical protein
MRGLSLLLLFTQTSGQLISMSVCDNSACSNNCVNWVATVGKCSPCDKSRGVCSITNPSSIVNQNSITFYSDSNCTLSIPGATNIYITTDNKCNSLISSGMNIGYYRAANLSLAIGVAVIIGVALIACCVCVCHKKRWCCFGQRPNGVDTVSNKPELNLPVYTAPPPPTGAYVANTAGGNYGGPYNNYPGGQTYTGVAQGHPGSAQGYAGLGQGYAGLGQGYAGVGQGYAGVGQGYAGVGQGYAGV